MPVPDSAVFARLAGLVAVDPAAGRPDRAVAAVFTGEPLGTVPVGEAADVAAAFERARPAQQRWAARPVAERAAVLERFRGLVLADLDALHAPNLMLTRF